MASFGYWKSFLTNSFDWGSLHIRVLVDIVDVLLQSVICAQSSNDRRWQRTFMSFTCLYILYFDGCRRYSATSIRTGVPQHRTKRPCWIWLHQSGTMKERFNYILKLWNDHLDYKWLYWISDTAAVNSEIEIIKRCFTFRVLKLLMLDGPSHLKKKLFVW